jgi:hypothetical protein
MEGEVPLVSPLLGVYFVFFCVLHDERTSLLFESGGENEERDVKKVRARRRSITCRNLTKVIPVEGGLTFCSVEFLLFLPNQQFTPVSLFLIGPRDRGVLDFLILVGKL